MLQTSPGYFGTPYIYCLPNIVRAIKQTRMRWGRGACSTYRGEEMCGQGFGVEA